MLVYYPAPKPTPKLENIYQNPFNYSSIEVNLKAALNDQRKEIMEKTLKDVAVSFKCKICSAEFPNKKTLIEHYELHKKLAELTDETITDRPICECGLDNPDNRHKIKEFICFECKEQFPNKYYYRFHMAKHAKTSPPFVCCSCKDFSTAVRSELIQHLVDTHNPDGTSQFYCNDCEKCFISQPCFEHHKIYHAKYKNLFCDLCKTFLPTTTIFKNHVENAHKITPSPCLKCDKCDIAFPKIEYLEAHTKQLHDMPKHLCNVCGKVFFRRTLLTTHMEIHGEAKQVCTVCGKRFVKAQHLQLHMRVHTGEKPNKCPLCEKRFSQRSSLIVHIRTHTGERPYPCGKCQKGFITKSTRDHHQKSCKKML